MERRELTPGEVFVELTKAFWKGIKLLPLSELKVPVGNIPAAKPYHVTYFYPSDSDTVYHFFVFENEVAEYVVLSIKAEKDLFLRMNNNGLMDDVTDRNRIQFELTVLNAVLDIRGHKGYKVLRGLDAYRKYFEHLTIEEAKGIYVLYGNSPPVEPYYRLLPFSSQEVMKEQYNNHLAYRIGQDKKDTLNPLNEIQIESQLIAEYPERIERESSRIVKAYNTHAQWRNAGMGSIWQDYQTAPVFFGRTEKQNVSVFIGWLNERMAVLENATVGTDFAHYLTPDGKRVLPWLVNTYTGSKIQSIAMMLFALQKLNLLTAQLYNYGKDELAEVVAQTFAPAIKGEKLTRQALNIAKYHSYQSTYQPKIDKEVSKIEAEMQRLKHQ